MSQTQPDALLVACDHASVTLAGRPALIDVSFRLHRGQTWLVLGRNGSGKSTLLRLLRGDIWPDDDGRGRRTFFPEGGPGRASPLGLRHRLGLVSPELALSFKRLGGHLTVAACILAGARDTLYFQGRPSTEETGRLAAILERLELAALSRVPVAALSNGQLRAVLLARSLAREPLALFLDEFLDGLDAQATELAGRVAAAAAAGGTAVVITSHRPAALPVAMAQGLVLAAGRVTDSGEVKAVLARYAAGLPEEPRRAEPAPLPRPEVARQAPGNDLPLVVMENASVMLTGYPALREVSLAVRPGEHLALLGANGSGKSTLLRLMVGEYHPAAGGRISRPGLAAPEGLTDLRDIRKRVGLVSFELEAGYDKAVTARDLVLSGLTATVGLFAEPGPGDVAEAMRWMASLGVADLAERQLGRLSAGQTRRLFLARAMVARPRLLLLDEPFAGLDAPSRRAAMAAVSALARSGVTVVTAVHRPGDIIPEIRIVRRLDEGRLLPEAFRPDR
jgi:molybdate transport system ATP-binding protein